MANLLLRNKEIKSVFQLLGDKENDISYSVAWAFANCAELLKEFIGIAINQYDFNTDDIEIRLQRNDSDKGYTDIEIIQEPIFYIIIEAKRGWVLPGKEQLSKYANRFDFTNSPSKIKKFIAMTECSKTYADLYLEEKTINGIEVLPISWKEIYSLTRSVYSRSNHAEKHILSDLQLYLGGLMTMQNLYSNMVYVVSLSSGQAGDSVLTYIDIVSKKGMYYHPVGEGWPKEPPNYIAFRYYGKLQSIHYIDGYDVMVNMHSMIPEIPEGEWRPHFLYHLGKGFVPSNEVKTGNIFRSVRVWCMLDTLFTCDTISDAMTETKRRLQEMQ